jgi:hypothetical protein
MNVDAVPGGCRPVSQGVVDCAGDVLPSNQSTPVIPKAFVWCNSTGRAKLELFDLNA